VTAGPPPLIRTLPGNVAGEVEARWLGPYVRMTRERIGAKGTTNVRWFDRDGRVVHEVSGPGVDWNTGYVSERIGGRTIIHGLLGRWKFDLPRKPGPPGYITSTQDSKAFLHQFHPVEGQIAVDVYVSGKHVSTIGPYQRYKGRDVQLGDDGSVALLIHRDEPDGRPMPGVVVAGPDGNLRFQADCLDQLDSPIPSLGGTGVLLRMNAGEKTQNVFVFYRKAGKVCSFDVGPNALFLAWIPGTEQALFSTSIGHEYRYELVNYSTGKTIWEIPQPVRSYPSVCCSVMVVENQVLLGGIEYAVIDVSSGSVIGRWAPDVPASRATRFARWDRRLFIVSDNQFGEFTVDDLLKRADSEARTSQESRMHQPEQTSRTQDRPARSSFRMKRSPAFPKKPGFCAAFENM